MFALRSSRLVTDLLHIAPASIYTNLDGHAGLAGFQWLFIVCGLISALPALPSAVGSADLVCHIAIPIAIYGYVLFPGTPERGTGHFLSAEERQLARQRLPPRPQTKLDWSVFKRVLGRWRWWMMCLIW